MKDFKSFVENLGLTPFPGCDKYCKIGNTYKINLPEMEGIYWFYDADQFIVTIHDFFVNKETIVSNFPDSSHLMAFSSSYIITANGECFNPYQPLSSNSLCIINSKQKHNKFILHENFPYKSVGINFKTEMIENCLSGFAEKGNFDLSQMFFSTKDIVLSSIKKISDSILSCKMSPAAAELFFEAKAKEWLSITLDAYISSRQTKKLSTDDSLAIVNVARYIDDHYASEIPQELLEKIATMSGTKLKTLFKEKFSMSITEYTQRRRMNIAETLLLKTNLEVKDIAKAVGYSSHSKFSSYYKKYKGMSPKEVKTLAMKN